MNAAAPIDLHELPQPKIEVISTRILGCFELRPTVVRDTRGHFAKIFHRPLWEKLGLYTKFEEDYVTHSTHRTIRGLHFQLPPMQHYKLVLCLRGSAFDVAVDLRRDSPTYRQYVSFDLTDTKANAILLPPGIAHGFCVTGTEALLYYKVSTVYSPKHDSGIRWDSAGIKWPISDPILSDRDRDLVPLERFDTPFTIQSFNPNQ